MKRVDAISDLAARIRDLPPAQQAEVEDFVEFLAHRGMDRKLLKAAARLTTPSLKKVWDNDEDAAYDRL